MNEIKCNTDSMSKTKLAFLVFGLAFGVNIAAFLFSKKTFVVEEVKNVWIYELPATASPLDAYSSPDMGPEQGIIGTLFIPTWETATTHDAFPPFLAKDSHWDEKTNTFTVTLKEGLTYSDGSPILAEHFVASSDWIKSKMKMLTWNGEWKNWLESKITAPDAKTLVYTFTGFSTVALLSHPFTGVIHPGILARLQKGEKITKDWISSGSYKVRKWNPKEIILISRDDFPVMLQKEFFRTLRFQSAPVKNPSCEFIQAGKAEERVSPEHQLIPVNEALHVFWVCRSWSQPGTFCSNEADRNSFSKALSATEPNSTQALAGKTLRYRIPFGSDAFRNEIIKKIETSMKAEGGTTQEVSYFFKDSSAADLELLFVVSSDYAF